MTKILDRTSTTSEQSEQSEQVCFFDYVRLSKQLEPYIFSIPNEGKRNFYNAKMLVKAGLKKGVSDIFVAIPIQPYHGLFIEMKSVKGKPTKTQLKFQKDVMMKGYMAVICYGCDEAIKVLNAYIDGRL
jgi:hypothetical protein